jgi:rhamnopyranosyl-N-acetylglucosaminyl-diphospho-decaprenol beta-1,3/1,4-galactofuranosyltransferase
MSDSEPDSTSPRLFGVLVTYRRPHDLEEHLTSLRKQSRALDQLIVVDNDPDPANERQVDSYRAHAPATYVPSACNTGAAGGIAQGLRAALRIADERDWVVLLDDDNPPSSDDLLERLFALAGDTQDDARIGGVGLTGARFDWRRARLTRFADEELDGTLDVDFVGGNQFPMLRVAAVRDVGVYRGELFWGLDDLDFGLRLRANGYRLLVSGELFRWARALHGRLGLGDTTSVLASRIAWRQYYTLRNLIDILRINGHPWLAFRVALVRGVVKSLAQFMMPTRHADLRLAARAVADGWRGNLGRTVEPATTS